MIIGVDAGCLGVRDEKQKTGVYQMAKQLLLQLGKIDKKNQYFLYSFDPIDEKLMKQLGKNMHNKVAKYAKGWLFVQLPLFLQDDKPDVFLGLSQAMPANYPFFSKTKTIGVVHDLAFEKFPKLYNGTYKRLHTNTQYLVKTADQLVAVSEATKKDMVKLYKAPVKKIVVMYEGVNNAFSQKGRKYAARIPFFLFVGSLKKTKNIPALLQGFNQFLKTVKKPYKLLLVGGDTEFDRDIEKTINDLNLSSHVERVGYATDEKIARLYRTAVAFVSPSMYEGFGLPFVEAMASGCPVIGSTNGAIPEVVGDAGIVVEPDNILQLENAMTKIATHKTFRTTLIKKGLKQAKKFSWEKSAEQLHHLISSYDKKNKKSVS